MTPEQKEGMRLVDLGLRIGALQQLFYKGFREWDEAHPDAAANYSSQDFDALAATFLDMSPRLRLEISQILLSGVEPAVFEEFKTEQQKLQQKLIDSLDPAMKKIILSKIQ